MAQGLLGNFPKRSFVDRGHSPGVRVSVTRRDCNLREARPLAFCGEFAGGTLAIFYKLG
jgi:hypothetical protein